MGIKIFGMRPKNIRIGNLINEWWGENAVVAIDTIGAEVGDTSLPQRMESADPSLTGGAVVSDEVTLAGSTAIKFPNGNGAMLFGRDTAGATTPIFNPGVATTLEYYMHTDGWPNFYYCAVDLNNRLSIGVESGEVRLWNNGSNPRDSIGSNVYPLNQWFHLAIVFDGGSQFNVYVNGTFKGTLNHTLQAYDIEGAAEVIASGIHGATSYLDRIQVTPGVKYSSAFTPPTY